MRPLAFRLLEAHNLSQRCSSYGSREKKFHVAVIKNRMVRELRSGVEIIGLKIVRAKKVDRLNLIVAEDSNRQCLRRRRVGHVNAGRKPGRQAHSCKEPNINPKLNPTLKINAATVYLKMRMIRQFTHRAPKSCENTVQNGSPSETFKRRVG